MKSPLFLLVAVLLATAVADRPAHGQTSLYNSFTDTTAATPAPGAAHFLQVLNLNLNQGPGTYNIKSIVVSFNFTSNVNQQVQLYFYTDVNTDPGAADALAHANLMAGSGLLSDPPPAAGNYSFTYNFADDDPFPITVPDSGALGVEFFLLNAGTEYYSTTANGRFTDIAPITGTTAGFAWNDADLNGAFAGSEQTRFGKTAANVRFALTGTLIKPSVRLRTYTRGGTVATLTVDGYNGVNYQLQRATSLVTAKWTNVGSAAAGATGNVLTFTDDDRTDPQAFYRVVASLPGSAGATASRPATRPHAPARTVRPD